MSLVGQILGWLGFQTGRSTVDDIQAVVDIATKARRETGKCKGFCALVSIDIRNALIPRGGTSASRRWCGKRFQTTCCE